MSGKILVVNATCPEMNHLAGHLARTGELLGYVRTYANQDRFWERVLAQLPVVGRVYKHTFGRRKVPTVLLDGSVQEAGVVFDIALAVVGRLVPIGNRFAGELGLCLARQISILGARYASQADIVVASYYVALPAFRACAGLNVLNYPTVHYRYLQKIVAEESEREPAFASMLPDLNAVPVWVESQLDMECELAARILVGSSFARDSFIAQGIPAEKLAVVPYGVDLSLFSPPSAGIPAGDGFRILYVGRIGQLKGIGYLMKAYDRFRGRGTSLTLVGNFHGSEESLRRYRKHFQHVSNVPRERLADIYRRADVFVFPSLLEGMGLVVLEAMASGLPVIVTPNGPGDIVRDGVDGFVVPIRDIDAIADRLDYFRANPEARKQMGANARERALEFTWEAYGQKARYVLDKNFDSSDFAGVSNCPVESYQ